ncbi:sperm-associated antigen 1-like [Oculina patagonica]
MGEDVGSGLLAGSNTTSGVPIEHLDYGYVGECKNSKELEKILKVLRSGDEGYYPELIEFTEGRLRKVNPKSKSLRKELPINTYRDLTKSEEQEITDDLQEWMTSIEQTDKSLKKTAETRGLENDNLPPIRTTTAAAEASREVSSVEPNPSEEKKKKKTVLPRGYHEWDRFDPDKEIESLEKKEEEKKKKQEKVKAMNKNAIPSNLDLKDKSETERQVLANKEKEKGNEAFQTGNYSEALMYYCRSIELNPKAAAVYNNRALAEIKLEKFQEAIDDCYHVLSMEPNNVKAFLRRSIAHQGQGLIQEAKEDLSHVLAIEPNNKRAKELLEEMKKKESTNGDSSKLGIPEDLNKLKNESEDNERTSSNNGVSAVTVNTPSAKPKGKRLKIVEVDSKNETETSQNLNGESHVSETSNKSSIDVVQETETIERTMETDNNLQTAEKPRLEKPPELPGLVVKGQNEGKRLFKLGRYAEAAEQFTQALDILQKDKVTFHEPLCALLCNRGSCMMKIGDCAGCVSDCTAALQILPGAFRPLLKRAEAYETSEKYAKAWLDYQMALKVWPQHLTALQGNYRVSKQLENLYGPEWKDKVSPPEPSPSESSSAPQATADDVLTHPTATQAASEVANQPHPPQSKINGATSATQPTPTNDSIGSTSAPQPSPPQDVAESTSATGQPSTVTDSSTLDPAVRFSHCKDQGNSFVKQNRYEEAVKCYTECIELDPENVAVYTNRALCYLRLDQHELAIEDTTEALRLQPENVKALFRRALAKKALFQYDSAARDLFALQKIEPKNAAAKKELDIVLDLCRKERRASQEKKPQPKKKTKEKKSEQQKPQNHEEQEPKWRRVPIKDVQENDEEDDEQPDVSTKPQSSPNSPPSKVPVNSCDETPKVKPVKLAKNTAYDFFQAWNSVKKNNTKEYAALLRQLETKRLAKVLSNKLDASMLISIIAALNQEIMPQGEEKLAWDILEQLSQAERFDMVLLFMSSKEKRELQQLFSKLQATTLQQSFVTSEDFDRLRKKYRT